MRDIKLPQVGLEGDRLLDNPCVRLASSVGRASERNFEGRGSSPT